jgi:hypothetical protein
MQYTQLNQLMQMVKFWKITKEMGSNPQGKIHMRHICLFFKSMQGKTDLFRFKILTQNFVKLEMQFCYREIRIKVPFNCEFVITNSMKLS